MFVFRPILNTSAEYDNFHFPAQPRATLPVIAELIWVTLSGGILANLFVLYLSFFSPSITGNYKYFLANLTFCDLCFNLSIYFEACYQMYHDFMNVPFTATTCYARVIFPYVFGACMMGFALPLIAVNRYVVVVLEREYWFTKQSVFLLCISTYLPLTVPLVDFLFAPYVTTYLDCNAILYTPYILEVVLMGLPLLGFCSQRIYRMLSQHITVVTARLNKTPEQIRDEKSILKAIVIQALIPVLFFLPTAVFLVVALWGGWGARIINLKLFSFGDNQQYQYTTMNLCFLIEMMVPTLDSFIILRVVKSYRRAANQILAKFKIC